MIIINLIISCIYSVAKSKCGTRNMFPNSSWTVTTSWPSKSTLWGLPILRTSTPSSTLTLAKYSRTCLMTRYQYKILRTILAVCIFQLTFTYALHCNFLVYLSLNLKILHYSLKNFSMTTSKPPQEPLPRKWATVPSKSLTKLGISLTRLRNNPLQTVPYIHLYNNHNK